MHLRLFISDLWTSHGPYVYAGTTSGFSLFSIAETFRGYPINAWIGIALSVATTALSWHVTERDRKQKAKFEEDRRAKAEEREAKEAQKEADRQAREDHREAAQLTREANRDKALLDLVEEMRQLKLSQYQEPDPTPPKRKHL